MQDENSNTPMNDEENDVTIDGTDLDDSVVSEEHAGDTIKKLREKLKIAEKEKIEYLTSLQRERADFVNFKKQQESEKKDLIKFASERLVDDLIPVMQNFDMAFANKEAWEKVDKNWRTGVEYIYNHLKQTLEGNGLTEINPLNEKFDIMRDEALEHVPVESKDKDGIVIEVVQKGYKLNGKVIRPARVKVGEFKN